MKADPYWGALFVFRGCFGDLIKMMWRDGREECASSKCVERCRFVWSSMLAREAELEN